MPTVLDWDCNGFFTYNTNIYSTIGASPGGVPSSDSVIDPNHYYISTANPRPGGASPQHLRVQWNAANDWGGRLTLETPSFTFRHLFATLYVAHSANWTPYSAGASKMIIFRTPTLKSFTYLQADLFGNLQPMVVIQDMDAFPTKGNFYQNVGAPATIQPGTGYHRVDHEVMLNDPGQTNGIVRTWVDGIKKAEYLSVDMGSGPNENFDNIHLDFLGSGSGTFPMFRDCDRVWVSTTALDGAAPPPPPPPPIQLGGGVGFAGQIISGGR